ncbi:unnamed protein product [Rotaria sp. Silwood2]|nr:unnamed protein product [Rotaria sp. Silwood2]
MNHNYPTLDLSTLQEFHRQYREHQAKVSYNQESFSSTQPKSNISSYDGTDDHHHRDQSMIVEEEFSDEDNAHEDDRHSEDKTKVNDEEKRKEEEEEEDQKWNELIQNYRNHIKQLEQGKKKKP